MKAVILAGGQDTHLVPLVRTVPLSYPVGALLAMLSFASTPPTNPMRKFWVMVDGSGCVCITRAKPSPAAPRDASCPWPIFLDGSPSW